MSATRNPLNVCPYWVEDVLVTMSKIPPQQRWPGTSWVQITDCMIRAADESHPAGSTGGAWEVVQTVEQLAKHKHIEQKAVSNGGYATVVNPKESGPYTGDQMTGQISWLEGREAICTTTTGSGQPMPIVNKYTAFYIWQRTG
ncbi:hypothetical protein [Gemmiger sp.]|uniref:hypothetical protein n=1 Tax=Gemmiger sp. TaxID=2049027 RepID=UPI003A92F9D3